MDIWKTPAPEPDFTYFNGNVDFLCEDYLRKILCKKKYRLDFDKGDLLLSSGDPVENCYFIDKGLVYIYEESNGRRHIVDVCGKGNLLLSGYLFFNAPSALSIECRVRSTFYSIEIEKVRKLSQTRLQFSNALLAQQTRNFLVAGDLLRKTISHNVGWLVSDFLIIMAALNGTTVDGVTYINDRMTQKQIADMLYINRITCLKELHRLEDLKLIDMQTRLIGIKNMPGLLEYRKSCESGTQQGEKEKEKEKVKEKDNGN